MTWKELLVKAFTPQPSVSFLSYCRGDMLEVRLIRWANRQRFKSVRFLIVSMLTLWFPVRLKIRQITGV